MTRCTKQTRAISLPILLALSWASSSFAQEQSPRAKITVTMSITYRGKETLQMASSDAELSIGESRTAFLYSSSDCTTRGVRNETPIASVDQYQYLWKFQMRLLSNAFDRVTFDLDWQRLEAVDGRTRFAAGDRRSVALRPGHRHALDFVVCSPGDAPAASVLIEVQAAPVEDPAYAKISLGYDLWLVYQEAGGEKTTRRITAIGRHAEKVPFSFPAVPLPLDRQSQPETDSPFMMMVDGTITGRVTRDGMIQVALEPRQQAGFSDRSNYFSGRKEISLRVAEAVDIELPPLNGYMQVPVEAAANITNPRSGVNITNKGPMQVDYKQYFAGTRTSLVLMVRRY